MTPGVRCRTRAAIGTVKHAKLGPRGISAMLARALRSCARSLPGPFQRHRPCSPGLPARSPRLAAGVSTRAALWLIQPMQSTSKALVVQVRNSGTIGSQTRLPQAQVNAPTSPATPAPKHKPIGARYGQFQETSRQLELP